MTGPSDPVRARAVRRAELARRLLAAARDEAAALRITLAGQTRRADEAEIRLAAAERNGAERDREVDRLEGALRELTEAHRRVLGSTLWRIASPARRAFSLVPAGLRRRLRRPLGS